jgi:protein-arginine kinase activator protein McsA
MPPEGYEDKEENEDEQKHYFGAWTVKFGSLEPIEELTIKQQINIANKKRKKAVKKENYLKAAKYRDIITELKK